MFWASQTACRCGEGRSQGTTAGYVPRLGLAGRDQENDVVAAIIIINRNAGIPTTWWDVRKLRSNESEITQPAAGVRPGAVRRSDNPRRRHDNGPAQPGVRSACSILHSMDILVTDAARSSSERTSRPRCSSASSSWCAVPRTASLLSVVLLILALSSMQW